MIPCPMALAIFRRRSGRIADVCRKTASGKVKKAVHVTETHSFRIPRLHSSPAEASVRKLDLLAHGSSDSVQNVHLTTSLLLALHAKQSQ
jgi:hypothetical protein